MANVVIKSLIIESTCDNPKCGKTFGTLTADVKTGRHTCDCDYPCDCPNNSFAYIEVVCPHCKTKNTEIISELK